MHGALSSRQVWHTRKFSTGSPTGVATAALNRPDKLNAWTDEEAIWEAQFQTPLLVRSMRSDKRNLEKLVESKKEEEE